MHKANENNVSRFIPMTDNLQCPLTHNLSACPVEPLLRELLNKVESMHQILKSRESKTRNSPGTTTKHLYVNRLVWVLQLEDTEKIWTSDDFAREIGCTSAAVRKTKAWKEYQKRLEYERQQYSQPKENF